MQRSASLPQTLRFGVFELDPLAGELRKKGMKIRLQGQPVDILVMLLQRPGETVTREELHKKLWPADTFVDFEQGLNNAMMRLRAALDDDAESPRFIETVRRRGYRFIGAVNGGPGNGVEPAALAGKLDVGDQPARHLRIGTKLAIVGLLSLAVAAALLLGLNVHGWRDRLFGGPARPQIRALAVLPLANLSGDPEQEYFADGMTEALITEMGKISAPRVISRQSIMQYKGSKKPLSEIARELKVDAVLEGAVERSGERVRVTIHLSQAAPDNQIWSQEYDRSIRDVLSLQGEIARKVAYEIRTKLTPEELTRLSDARPVNPVAYDDYLRGRYLLGLMVVAHNSTMDKTQNNEADIQSAIGHFRHAIDNDRAYALAYGGLADAYLWLGTWGGHSPKEILPEAKAAARRALELDPSLGEAHFSLAQTLQYDWNWPEAEKEYQLALKLSPNYVDAHMEYGRFVQALGRNDEAMTQMTDAMKLDPFGIRTRIYVAWVTYASRHYDPLEQFKRLGDDWGMIFAYREKRMYPEAMAAWERWKTSHPLQARVPSFLATPASIYGLEGRKREAQELIDELEKTAKHRYVPGCLLAEAYVGIGETGEAVSWLEQAYKEQDQCMAWINAYPGFDLLRSEPRFQELLRRMNFPQ